MGDGSRGVGAVDAHHSPGGASDTSNRIERAQPCLTIAKEDSPSGRFPQRGDWPNIRLQGGASRGTEWLERGLATAVQLAGPGRAEWLRLSQ